MQRENNFHPNSGICRRLIRYIFNALKVLNVTQGLYTRPKLKSGDDMGIKLRNDHDAGCEVEILFKETDEPEYRKSNNFETVLPPNDRPKIETDVAEADKEKRKGKKVVDEIPTVIPDQPEHPRVLLDVDSNINQKSDKFIQSVKEKMRNIDIEPKAY